MSAPRTHPTTTTYPVAELERRFYAFALDQAVIVALAGLVGWLAWLWQREVNAVFLGVIGGFLVLLWLTLALVSGATGSSPGKRLLGLRVVHHGTGTPIGAGPSLLRSFILAISAIPTFGFGLAALAWTAVEDSYRQRRGWHDHVSHAVVVDVRPVPETTEAAESDAPRHVVNLTAMRLIPAPPVEVPQAKRTLPDQIDTPTPLRRSPEPPPTAGPPRVAPPSAAPAVMPPHQMPHQMPHPAPPQQAPSPAPPLPAPPAPRPQPQPQSQPQPQPQPLSQPQPHPMSQPRHLDPDNGRTVSRSAPQGPVLTRRWRVRFDTGESFILEGVAIVGRRPEPRPGEVVQHVVPLPSTDMSLSKTHAQLGPMPDGSVVVMDRGSTNGSLLLRQGLTRALQAGKPLTLRDGDRVVFGDRQMTLTRED